MTHVEDSFSVFFCSFPSYHFGGGIARAAAHKSFCFYALFSPEAFDKNCSIVLLTIDYYVYTIINIRYTQIDYIGRAFCMEYVTHLREDGSYQPLNNAVG